MIAPLLLLLQAVPPVPPPPAVPHEAAIALWAEHPPDEALKRDAINGAVWNAAAEGVARAGLKPGQRRWPEKVDALRPRIAAHVPANREELDSRVAACAAERIAYDLSVAEINEVRRFMSTPVGKKFWSVAGIGVESLRACYGKLLDLRATDGDLRAVGLKPPRQSKQRFRPGEIVS